MDPRISFSYGFADAQQQTKTMEQDAITLRGSAASQEFEFSTLATASFSLNSCAEELFFQGKILPSKGSSEISTTTTLRDELLAGDDGVGGSDDVRIRRKGSIRWKERFGFRKSRAQSKAAETTSAC